MTSTNAVQNEIERFLRSAEPEVICITGDWGVGKTYTWQLKLDQLRTGRAVGLARYSYVSLFGINSLEGLKQSIFENMKFIVPEGQTGYERIVAGANRTFQQGKRLVQATPALPIIGDALTKISQPFLFSSIFNQIICIDDLERRGINLSVKDVFGLISYLREQKGCKIVLLLNEAKLEHSEFQEYFEKVIDAKLVFSPTSTEAAAIAFRHDDILSGLLREYSVKLGVKNIRVMKKIERLVGIIVSAIPKVSDDVRRQIVHSLVLFGWCKFNSGANPPSLDYFGESAIARAVQRQSTKEAPSENERRWEAILVSYDFRYPDDFDLALKRFVDTGVLDLDEVVAEASKQEASLQRSRQAGSFERSFRPLHDSFSENEDEVCNALLSGIKDNIVIASLPNLDAVVGILERLDRTAAANELIDFVVKEAPDGYWLNDDPFRRVIKSSRLKAIIGERREVTKPVLNFEQDLITAAQNLNGEKIAQLAAVPQEDYLKLFESKAGDQLRSVVLSALEFRKYGNSSADMKVIAERAEGALRTIGKRSALQALRVETFGVSLGDEPLGRISS
jgi:hypothetical protein